MISVSLYPDIKLLAVRLPPHQGKADPKSYFYLEDIMRETEIAYSPITTAILVDGGFYRKRFEKGQRHSPEDAADALMHYCGRHLWERNSRHSLYRIFYYDCLPCDKKIFHPFYDKTIDYSKSEFNSWMNAFLDCLKTKRKVCLCVAKG